MCIIWKTQLLVEVDAVLDGAYEIYHEYYYLLTQHNRRNAGQ